ncbi:hypothetical protein KHA80_14480 [Anaerobacillus sp. HL2]|nr:hypothetical protein KHA80_14480 [Anaerobacillus sp. HL2]
MMKPRFNLPDMAFAEKSVEKTKLRFLRDISKKQACTSAKQIRAISFANCCRFNRSRTCEHRLCS